MKTAVKLPRHAWVLVGDGRKCLFLRNDGDALHPELVVKQTLESASNPPTRDHGTDAPGRAMHGGQRSAMGQTDWHEQAETDFAGQTAQAVASVCEVEAVKALIVVAPPRMLANLRKSFPPAVKALVTAEINKDLTNLPPDEITRHLVGS